MISNLFKKFNEGESGRKRHGWGGGEIRAGMSLQKLNDNDIVQGGNVHKFSCNQKRVAENFDG